MVLAYKLDVYGINLFQTPGDFLTIIICGGFLSDIIRDMDS